MREDNAALTAKDIQAIDAARLYYEYKLKQDEVAARLHVSRPTVSKLLAHAHHRGFVRIEVLDPREHDELVITRLTTRYDLAEVRLVSAPHHLPGQLRAALGAQGADLLATLLRDGDVLAVQADTTIAEVVRNLNPTPRRHLRVLQMSRVLSDCLARREESQSPRLLAATLGAQLAALPGPVLAESVPAATALRASSPLKESLAGLRTARLALFSLTTATHVLAISDRLGLSPHDHALLRTHVAGEVCGHLVDADGSVCLPDLNNRTLGMSLTDLRHVEQKICVTGGADTATQARILHAALTGGYINRLIVDVDTAREVLRLDPEA